MSNAALSVQSCDCLTLAVDALSSAGSGRWLVATPKPDDFWRVHATVEEEAAEWAGSHPELESLRDQDVALGFLGRCHLGDAICSTPLARLLVTERNCRVYSARIRGVYKVFENNPYLTGYQNEGRIALGSCAVGPGHMIQKLTRAFGFPIEPFPKGELYLSDAELKWAWTLRAQLPRNRPIAIVSAGSLTDNSVVPTGSLLWREWVDILSRTFTVVQVAVTKLSCIEELVRISDNHRRLWRPDIILDNCFVLENLSARQFFSIFAVADLFLGTSSGGVHVAAAMNVPAIVALPRSKYGELPVFPDRVNEGPWHHESFLYPYHAYLLQE